jgi:hypothetical protein
MRLRTPFVGVAIGTAIVLSGCSRAPSVEIVGSFFPSWMICIAIAVIAVFIGRAILLRFDFESHVQPLWLFYPCSVILCACGLWEVFYR